jgi:hypothetical protein
MIAKLRRLALCIAALAAVLPCVARAQVEALPIDTAAAPDTGGAVEVLRTPVPRLRFAISSGKTYNRVEGLPVHLGPTISAPLRESRLSLDVHGIIRSANTFYWDGANLGHLVRADVQPMSGRGLGFTASAYDIVDAVEDWQMPRGEAGIATFLFHRDYRDHYGRHGAAAVATYYLGENTRLSASFANERWTARQVRQVLTVLRNNHEWRPNPVVDEGRARLFTLDWRTDSRNDPRTPSSGWLSRAEYEYGDVDIERFGPTSFAARFDAQTDPSYGRLLLDVRRYNRIGPSTQINLRAVAAGWLHGDELPLQRRLSVGGVATIPGFDFRKVTGQPDAATCSDDFQRPGTPAQCERVLLLQAEYREELPWRPGTIFSGTPLRVRSAALTLRPVFVAFADVGRGWLVRRRDDPGFVLLDDIVLFPPRDLVYSRGSIPPPNTFMADVGIGIDVGLFGVYVAKALSESGEPVNLLLRARSRF